MFRDQLAAERAQLLSASDAEPGALDIDRLRDERRLDEARAEAMLFAERHPDDPEAVWRAARSLADTALGAPDESVRAGTQRIGVLSTASQTAR